MHAKLNARMEPAKLLLKPNNIGLAIFRNILNSERIKFQNTDTKKIFITLRKYRFIKKARHNALKNNKHLVSSISSYGQNMG